jgi:murein DD-endopeptidase MepM/ murein hydrolase activator NlpD
MRLRLRILLASLLLPLAIWAALPLVSSADPQGQVDRLQGQIDSKRQRLDHAKGRARLLTSDITAFNERIGGLQHTIDGLQRRQDQLQGKLDVKRRELSATQTQLRSVRARLTSLRARLATSRRVLAARLVEVYKSDEPDMISVVLDSQGFADLLENGAYLQRIGEQDRKIINAVRVAKAESESAEAKLRGLEQRQREIADAIDRQRNDVARNRVAVVDKRDEIGRAREAKRRALYSVQEDAHHLNEDIGALQAQQAKIQRRIQAVQNPTSTATAPGPIRGGGRFIWPVNGPITSQFCESRSWESCHPGIDIGVGTGTPIRAAGTGTVILAGPNGGYGNFTCIDHGGGVSTCYGHQSAIQVSVGQHVSQGQVIGLSGNTGFSFGPHLHFEVRINGSVTNPMNYLG